MAPDSFSAVAGLPFGGGSSGVPVGPIGGACISAAWSTDGAWMYFSAKVAGHSHLWRQRFPGGEPQQITSGPTDEETVFAAPDGRSLLTSIDRYQGRHPCGSTTLMASEYLRPRGNAFSPWLSTDARHLYFLSANNSTAAVALSRMDLATGSHEVLLSEFNVREYDHVAADEQQVVFTIDRDGVSEIWLAPLDRHAPPRLLIRGGDQPRSSAVPKVSLRKPGKRANYLHCVNLDGSSNDNQVLSTPYRPAFKLSHPMRDS